MHNLQTKKVKSQQMQEEAHLWSPQAVTIACFQSREMVSQWLTLLRIGHKIADAIAEVTNEPIKYLIYSHSHRDHIGGAYELPSGIEIIAHKDTSNFLKMGNHTDRPLPTKIFDNETTITLGNTTVQLAYGGPYHQNGNIFIYAPNTRY